MPLEDPRKPGGTGRKIPQNQEGFAENGTHHTVDCADDVNSAKV
jgi:hypothetical protein